MFESTTTSISLSFDGRAAVFRDHFPGEPLVPAFLQLTTIRRQAAQSMACSPSQVLVRTIKFVRPLFPDESVTLRLEQGAKEGAVRFELLRGDELVTHGDLVIE